MLRAGKIKLIFRSIYIELAHRAAIIQTLLSRPKPLDDIEVPGSAFIDRRKVLPASFRPTVAQAPIAAPLRADPDVVASELKHILSSIHFEDGTHT
jgi:hypothetical protein